MCLSFFALEHKLITIEWICLFCLCSPSLTFESCLNLYWGYIQNCFWFFVYLFVFFFFQQFKTVWIYTKERIQYKVSFFEILFCINTYFIYLELTKEFSCPFCFCSPVKLESFWLVRIEILIYYIYLFYLFEIQLYNVLQYICHVQLLTENK